MKALFLSHRHSLSEGGGGQQLCTHEYRDALRAAGFDLEDCTFETDRTWGTRLRRRLRPAPYADLIPNDFYDRLAAVASERRPAFVFCNLHNFVPVASRLRGLLDPGIRLVLLSHGLASVDHVHAARIAKAHPEFGMAVRQTDAWIGEMLRIEREGLPVFDHVFCLAPFEVEVCRWLGARSVSWIPRVVDTGRPLDWQPAGDRVGCVGTLDHPPNREGIEALCEALAAARSARFRLRLVTRSDAVAQSLGQRYAFIDHLGPLEEPGALEAEAATWNVFVHPIFCFAMGCSTKLATGLRLGLPVATTAAGVRGYLWRTGGVEVAETPVELAARTLELLLFERAADNRRAVLAAASSAPSITDVADTMRRDLLLDHRPSNRGPVPSVRRSSTSPDRSRADQ